MSQRTGVDAAAPTGPRAGSRPLVLAAVFVLASIGSVPAEAYGPDASDVPVIEGGASLAAAPTVEPGSYRDRLAKPGERHFYRIDVPAHQELWASAVLSAPGPLAAPDDPDTVADTGATVAIQDAQGTDCTDESDSDVAADLTGQFPILAHASSGTVGTEESCAAGPLFVSVSRDGVRGPDQSANLELVFALRPTISAPGEPQAEPVQDEGPAPSQLPAETMSGGASFSDARTVGPGNYRIRMDVRETRVLRLQVGEGQRLRWRAEVVSGPEDSSRTLRLRVRDPLRIPVAAATDSSDEVSPEQGAIMAGGTAAPIRAANATSEDYDVATTSRSGTHYVTLEYVPGYDDEPDADLSDPVEVALTLEVAGKQRPVPQPAGASRAAGAFGGMPWYRVTLGAGALAAGVIGLGLIGAGLWRRRATRRP